MKLIKIIQQIEIDLFEVLVGVLQNVPLSGEVLDELLDLVDVLVHGVGGPGPVGFISQLLGTDITHTRDTHAVLRHIDYRLC